MESLETTCARIETKLDAALVKLQDHEDRIRKVEGWRSYVIGVAAGVGLIFAFVKDAIIALFQGRSA
jgi:hypothetical protein